MKTTIKLISLVAIALLFITSCGEKKGTPIPGITAGLVDSTSYAVGASLGSMVKQAEFGDLNMKELHNAIDDVLKGDSLKMDMAFANEIITKYLTKKQESASIINTEKGKKYLEENKGKEGVIALESGLQYKVITEGNGNTPAPEDTIEVNYKGMLIDGTEFDSSYKRGETATLALNQFIPGWIEGVQKVSEGGKIELYIPAELAYGSQKMGTIEPGSTLIFEVELIKIKKAAAVVTK
ncbi:MAG: peptidylprolyl isomerase [Bacteroidetes bacterium HGW-Bacteroidetes-8]|jgi:FKBP-type peptidyl-prolyl cis-trans isomerase FkpA|nr:MAG: peptidylprolyl isomerase [Bacteroidetes bacterium HGW-Bacteroidetes-8]